MTDAQQGNSAASVPHQAPLRAVVKRSGCGATLECGHTIDECTRGVAARHRCGTCQRNAAVDAVTDHGGLRVVR